MTRTFKIWLASFLAIALFTPISVLWLDRPIALFMTCLEVGRSPEILPITNFVYFTGRFFIWLLRHYGAQVFEVRDGHLVVRYQRSG